MSTNTLFPLILLYTNNRSSIDGATRFQKLVFLAQEESKLPNVYEFRADRFGPFSPALHSDLQEFEEKGYIQRTTTTNNIGQPKFVYGLSDKGYRVAKKLVEDYRSSFETADEVKSRYNDVPINEVIRYVYQKYPKYTTASDLDLDRLFDPDAHSQFTEIESVDKQPETVRDLLQPTPHTLWQLPRRDTNAYFYYLTDSAYTQRGSKFQKLDDCLTIMGRHRTGLEVVIIDRDRIGPDVWSALTDGFDIDSYPALIAAEGPLGVGDVDLNASTFTPTDHDYAKIENGVIQDSILKDQDDIRDFLNTLYDAARDDNIRETMEAEKVVSALTVAKKEILNVITFSP